MPRLIDADKLRKDILDLPNCYNGFSDAYDKAYIIDVIDEQPTVDIDAITASHEQIGFDKGFRDGYAQATVDAEPVVRCKDCKHFSFWCELHETRVDPEEDYCSWAEGYKRCPYCGAKMDETEERLVMPKADGSTIKYEYVGRLVRCKDCKYLEEDECPWTGVIDWNGYCSRGERREDGNNDRN